MRQIATILTILSILSACAATPADQANGAPRNTDTDTTILALGGILILTLIAADIATDGVCEGLATSC
ncbi:hypothetical protein FHS89_001436 [Rubricella aquisinus]|uniref:Uncharacterized protein n=1 Tax=Rubricella aquisinus TaxID=2028108 RepID=A0A840WYG6_9RHOB|nr:hypothetical protein [Rubricella aquisinus]MBB5515424.1 hypothetical protein [Rubricella aquisinus]